MVTVIIHGQNMQTSRWDGCGRRLTAFESTGKRQE